MRKIFLAGIMGLLLSAPLASYSYGMMYDDNCCNPCEQQCCCDFTASIDYLYWNVCRSGLDTIIDSSDFSEGISGKVRYVDNEWDSGFRVQLGYMCDENTGLLLRYTHFQASPEQHIESVISGATRLHPAAGGSFRLSNSFSTDAEYSIQFNVLDIEAGSWMSRGCDSKLRPFLGLRFGWINQDIDTVYETDDITPIIFGLRQKNDMDSYGVTLGIDFRHTLCDCFNLIGRVAAGAHYGDFTYNTIQEDIFDPASPTPQVNVYSCDCRAVYSSEVAVGLEYEFCAFCGSELSFAFGYELHTWHGLMDFQDFPNGGLIIDLTTKLMRDDASLLLHGLFVRLGASF